MLPVILHKIQSGLKIIVPDSKYGLLLLFREELMEVPVVSELLFVVSRHFQTNICICYLSPADSVGSAYRFERTDCTLTKLSAEYRVSFWLFAPDKWIKHVQFLYFFEFPLSHRNVHTVVLQTGYIQSCS